MDAIRNLQATINTLLSIGQYNDFPPASRDFLTNANREAASLNNLLQAALRTRAEDIKARLATSPIPSRELPTTRNYDKVHSTLTLPNKTEQIDCHEGYTQLVVE